MLAIEPSWKLIWPLKHFGERLFLAHCSSWPNTHSSVEASSFTSFTIRCYSANETWRRSLTGEVWYGMRLWVLIWETPKMCVSVWEILDIGFAAITSRLNNFSIDCSDFCQKLKNIPTPGKIISWSTASKFAAFNKTLLSLIKILKVSICDL